MPVTGVHLVGSIPAASNLDALTTASSRLPSRLRRLPDGETGWRYYWVNWQTSRLNHLPDTVFISQQNPDYKFVGQGARPEAAQASYRNHDVQTDPAKMSAEKKAEFVRTLPPIDTGYDEHAIESYAVFRELKKQGKIPQGTRFQVSLPTPLPILAFFIREPFRAAMEPIYQEALGRALQNIYQHIPKKELAVQWDAAAEFMILEGIPVAAPWWSKPGDVEGTMTGIQEKVAALVDMVDDEVEVGLHLCYGDAGHAHFKEPEDLGLVVALLKGVAEKANRRVDFVHMPVPKDRVDEAYFAPLKPVTDLFAKDGSNGSGKTELYLGLVHTEDSHGTGKRIETAEKVLGPEVRFGVATECGMGRTPEQHLDSIWEILKDCSQPWRDL